MASPFFLSGTLTSITNFASSVSRNMDKLSLDVEHQERQEESRRRDRPDGLTQGLYNGLTGLGLSLLGESMQIVFVSVFCSIFCPNLFILCLFVLVDVCSCCQS